MNSLILLAAGRSSRMGRLKALLPWGGATLIEKQIEAAAISDIDELIVVTGFKAGEINPFISKAQIKYKKNLQIKTLFNEKYESGKSSSIRAGMACLSKYSHRLLIAGVDQPLHAAAINVLLSHLREKQIVVPVYNGRSGHPPGFSASFYDRIKDINEETEGLRAVVKTYKNDTCFTTVPGPQVLLNLNNYEDYQYAREKQLDNY